MGKNIKVFLRNSFISVISVCIVVFIYLLLIMAKSTESTIDEISEIYMSEMNIQIRQKFSSIVGLRLEQVEGVFKRMSSEGGLNTWPCILRKGTWSLSMGMK